MTYGLVHDENVTIDDIGILINKTYPNIRFLFEIDFTKDDYVIIKDLFLSTTLIHDDYIVKGYFHRYFRNYRLHRIPFLLLVIGFIRFNYLDNENPANFFSNFVRNILGNENTSISQLAIFFEGRLDKYLEV